MTPSPAATRWHQYYSSPARASLGLKPPDPGKKPKNDSPPQLPGHTEHGAPGLGVPGPERPWNSRRGTAGEEQPSDIRRRARSRLKGPAPPPALLLPLPPAALPSPPLHPPSAVSPPLPSLLSPPPQPLLPSSLPSPLPLVLPSPPAPEERAAEGTSRLLPPAAARSAV